MQRHATVAVADVSMRRFASLARAIPVPGVRAVGDWSSRDVVAHLVGGIEAYASILEGKGSPVAEVDGIGAFNARNVASVPDRDLGVLAARIEGGLDRALAVGGDADPATVVSWHGGVRLPISTVWAALAGEALVHGYDVARAAARPWTMPADEVRTTILGLLSLLPHFVDASAAAGFSACFDLRLRGAKDARAFLTFEDGALAVEEPHAGRVDCVISADPAAYLLVAYGRSGPIRPALAGKVVAWGRKPHLALRLNHLFKNP